MKVVIGNHCVVSALEEALAEAKAGTLVGVVICGVTDGDGVTTGSIGWQGGVKDDVAFPWPRLLASVAHAHSDLIRDGLDGWE